MFPERGDGRCLKSRREQAHTPPCAQPVRRQRSRATSSRAQTTRSSVLPATRLRSGSTDPTVWSATPSACFRGHGSPARLRPVTGRDRGGDGRMLGDPLQIESPGVFRRSSSSPMTVPSSPRWPAASAAMWPRGLTTRGRRSYPVMASVVAWNTSGTGYMPKANNRMAWCCWSTAWIDTASFLASLLWMVGTAFR